MGGLSIQSLIDPDRWRDLPLTRNESDRYARHLVMPEVTMDGQRRLKAARVLCVGLGGLGSPAAMYLAAAGIGEIGLIDGDVVDYSNLQRQILHTTADVGRRKTNSARDTILALNPGVRARIHPGRLCAENALDIIREHDVIIDGSDNFPTRYLVGDACVLARKPNVYASIHRFEGQATVFAPHLRAGCHRCMAPAPPPPESVPSCAEGGVLGLLPGLVGTIQATEAVKLILGVGEPLLGRLLRVDALTMRFQSIALRKDPACRLCGDSPDIQAPIDHTPIDHTQTETSRSLNPPTPITPDELGAQLKTTSPPLVIDLRESAEFAAGHIPGAIPIPAHSLASRLSELDDSNGLVLVCHHGLRSHHALHTLRHAGLQNSTTLKGGMQAWLKKGSVSNS